MTRLQGQEPPDRGTGHDPAAGTDLPDRRTQGMKGRSDDIIDLPHHVSKKHPQMPVSDRAAQFSPFAALTGYDEAVEDTVRLDIDGKTDTEYVHDEEDMAYAAYLKMRDND